MSVVISISGKIKPRPGNVVRSAKKAIGTAKVSATAITEEGIVVSKGEFPAFHLKERHPNGNGQENQDDGEDDEREREYEGAPR
jgi:hypothetical protein